MTFISRSFTKGPVRFLLHLTRSPRGVVKSGRHPIAPVRVVVVGAAVGVDKAETVSYTHLARGIFVDAHSVPQQCLIVGASQKLDILLVGHIRGDDLHVHTAFGGSLEGGDGLVVQNQIGRSDADGGLGPIDEVQVDIFSHIFPV